MKKLFVFLVFIIFSKEMFSSHDIGLQGAVKVAEETYLFKGNDNKLKFYDNKGDFYLIITINKEDKDKSSITFVDNLKKYYVSVTKREINSIATLKNLFSPKSKKDKNYQIKEKGKNKEILNFEFKEYFSSSEIGEIDLFFSKEMDAYLRKFITYDDFINFLKDTDLSSIPFIDSYFELIKYFINQSLELGFIGEIYLNRENLYSISSLKESIITNKEFEIPKNYEKKGIESFLGDF